jgi:hypothetical protein
LKNQTEALAGRLPGEGECQISQSSITMSARVASK